LGVLSFAATARNIYLAPALPGAALLLGWWVAEFSADAWDARALRGTCLLLWLAALAAAAAVAIVGRDSWAYLGARAPFVAVSALGLVGALAGTVAAWRASYGLRPRPAAACALLLAYCALLAGPASQLYRAVDAWQDLASIGRAIGRDAAGRPLILFAPDETTRAFIDMYARPEVGLIPGPATPESAERLRVALAADPQSLIVAQLPGRNTSRTFEDLAARLGIRGRDAPRAADAEQSPAWASGLPLRVAHRYALPNGRRYALLEFAPATALR
jgi:hypothetical protein